jgi:hypothetical protein
MMDIRRRLAFWQTDFYQWLGEDDIAEFAERIRRLDRHRQYPSPEREPGPRVPACPSCLRGDHHGMLYPVGPYTICRCVYDSDTVIE